MFEVVEDSSLLLPELSDVLVVTEVEMDEVTKSVPDVDKNADSVEIVAPL